MARRRTFSAEFKREAVGLARSSEQSTSQAARNLGIRKWGQEHMGTDHGFVVRNSAEKCKPWSAPYFYYAIKPRSTSDLERLAST